MAALANENEGSDTEEGAVERGAASGNGNGEPASSVNNEVGGGNDVESDTEDLMVESESDSDQSNQDGSAQRSVQTGATAGSDAGNDFELIPKFIPQQISNMHFSCLFTNLMTSGILESFPNKFTHY